MRENGSLPNDWKTVVKDRCYIALSQIIKAVKEDTLNDIECFMKIEKIITIFEENGSTRTSRHDF